MNCSHPYKALFWLFGCCGLAFCIGANTVSVEPNSAYFIGPQYSFSKREGFYDFADIRKSQLRPRNSLNMFGAAAGKRFLINKFIRFQAGVLFETGSVINDTLALSSETTVKYFFYHASFEPEMQLPLALTGRTRPFILIGGGFNYLYIRERTFFLDNGQEIIWIDLPPYIRSGAYSVSGSAGFGFDYTLTRSATISLWYSFRYWQPVHYGIKENFPKDDQPYHENFFSNRFQLALLFDIR
jgi:hypothetical protein